MPPILARAGLAALLTVTALPAAASAESFRLDSHLALEPSPRLEATRPANLKSPALSVALSGAAPLALTTLGSGLMVLSGYPTEVNALSVLGMVVWTASPLALGAGQAYAGDPQRGLWVGLGTYGAITGSVLLGLGAAYALDAQAMSAGGQSAGMRYALLTFPIASVVSVAYTIWALADAHQTAIRHNEAVEPDLP